MFLNGSDSVYCEESVEEMEPLSSKLPPTKRKTRDVDKFHWETEQRTSEDTTTDFTEQGEKDITTHLLTLKYKEMC